MDRAEHGSSDRAGHVQKEEERPAKRALTGLATSLKGWANNGPPPPRRKGVRVSGLAPEPDQPGPDTQKFVRAPVRSRAHRHNAGDRTKATGSSLHASESNATHVQLTAAQIGGAFAPVPLGASAQVPEDSETAGKPLAATHAAHESAGHAQQSTTRDQLVQLRAMLGAYQAAFQAAGLQLPALPSGSAIDSHAAARVKGHEAATAVQIPTSAHTSTMGGGAGAQNAAGISPKTVSGGEPVALEPTMARSELGKPDSSGLQDPGSEDGGGLRSGGNKYVNLRSLGAPGPRDLGMEHVPSPLGAFTPRAPTPRSCHVKVL